MNNDVYEADDNHDHWYVLAKSHLRAERGAAWLRTVVLLRLNGAPPGCAQLCSPVCLRF